MSFKFTSILKELINEAEKIDFMVDKFLKPKESKDGKKMKPALSKEEFLQLIQGDPKTKLNRVDVNTASDEDIRQIKPGGYSEWIIKHYLNPDLGEYNNFPVDSPEYKAALKTARELYLENLYKITTNLQKFIRFRERIQGERDLQKLTPDQLYDKVKDFSLEKTKGTKQEKEEAKTTFEYPGSEVIYRGADWTVVKIEDKGELGKNAACFFGGWHMESGKGETNWCTSSPGYNWFERYINKGPLYVIIPNNWSGRVGEKSGLPAERYQFHFEDQQFMDVNDRQVDLISLLNGKMSELKPLFKKYFAEGLVTKGDSLEITSFTSGAVGKFVALYGLEDLFENLPETLEVLSIVNRNENIIIDIPASIGRFKNLEMLALINCIKELPEQVCELENLNFLSLIGNTQLTRIPDCVADLPSIVVVNLRDSSNVKVPESFKTKAKDMGDNIWDFQSEIAD
jgi:Leucine-rich repeat (LRR) protein